jgi:integrase
VALYLSDLARTAKPATLQRRLSSISQAHQAAGHPTPTVDPVVRAVHAGIRRTQGTAPTVKAPAVTAELRAMVEHLPGDLRGVRDRALLLLVGFAAALRRSELVALDRCDVAETAEGLVVTLRRSKSDPEGAGRKIGVPCGSHPTTCPVRALRAWTELAGIVDGPLFLTIDRSRRLGNARTSDRAVARAVQRAAQGAGLDPARYAGPPYGPASPPQPPPPGPANAPSWPRPATNPCPWCAAISETGPYSATTPPPPSGFSSTRRP